MADRPATPVTKPKRAAGCFTRGADTASKYSPNTGPVANPAIFNTLKTVLSVVPMAPTSKAIVTCKMPNKAVAMRPARS